MPNDSKDQLHLVSTSDSGPSSTYKSGLGHAVFLTWERHRRTRSIAEYFDIPLLEIVADGSRWRRYPRQILRTIGALRRSAATRFIVQNPSLLLSVTVVLWRGIFARKRFVVIDAHNQAVVPFMSNNFVVRALSRYVLRKANLTLVTNRFLVDAVERRGGHAVVLPDRLPAISPCPAPPMESNGPMRVLVIATFAPDEPIDAILQAARIVGSSVEFSFTGDSRKVPDSTHASAGKNVRFLGYLDEHAYWQAMAEAHVVLDLTLMPDCLVCGAYEAVAMGRPVVLSNTVAQREYFREAGTYSDVNPQSIADALGSLREHYFDAVSAVMERREVLAREWHDLAAKVAGRIAAFG